MWCRYGETCVTAASCVPTTASMICAAPFTGASTTVCRCNAATQYYDLYRETCLPLKTFRQVCRDSSECLDAYPVSVGVSATAYCGFIPTGSLPVCVCAPGSRALNTNRCVVNTGVCIVNANNPQCPNNQYCNAGACACPANQYLNATTDTCDYLKYQGDSCSAGSECWSNSCGAFTANLCD